MNASKQQYAIDENADTLKTYSMCVQEGFKFEAGMGLNLFINCH